MKLTKLTDVKIIGKNRLSLQYDNGFEGEYNLGFLLKKEGFERLNSEEYFGKLTVCSKSGDIVWPEGESVCSNAIYRQLELIESMRRIGIDLDIDGDIDI